MEITSTIVTRMARQQTDKASFGIEYSTVDGSLQHVQLTIYSAEGDAAAGEYCGNVHFNGNDFTCNLAFSEQIPHYVEKSMEFIRQIVEECAAVVPAAASEDSVPVQQSR